MALLLSSYPRNQISRDEFQREIAILFMPVHAKRWPLRRFRTIQTDLEFRLPLWTIIFFGFTWLMVRSLDLFMPWMGGSFIIRLRTWKKADIVAWQGNSESDFRANLQTLQAMTGLPVER